MAENTNQGKSVSGLMPRIKEKLKEEFTDRQISIIHKALFESLMECRDEIAKIMDAN